MFALCIFSLGEQVNNDPWDVDYVPTLRLGYNVTSTVSRSSSSSVDERYQRRVGRELRQIEQSVETAAEEKRRDYLYHVISLDHNYADKVEEL